MALDFKKFFKRDGNTVKFTGVYMEVYLPKVYFDQEISILLANRVETLGIFNFKLFNNLEGTNGSLHTYKFASSFITYPAEIEYKKIEMMGNEDEYTVLKYYNNDIFIENVMITMLDKNASRFMKLITSGKLPITIPYNDIINLVLNNFEINDFNPNVPSIIIEEIIMELNRDPDDLTKPFRYKASNPKQDMYKAKRVDIKSIPQVSTSFTAVTFENFDYSVVTAINKTMQNVKEVESPVEKTIKF